MACGPRAQVGDTRMARFKVRNLIGHFVKPRSVQGKGQDVPARLLPEQAGPPRTTCRSSCPASCYGGPATRTWPRITTGCRATRPSKSGRALRCCTRWPARPGRLRAQAARLCPGIHQVRRLFPRQLELADQRRDHDHRDRAVTGYLLQRDRQFMFVIEEPALRHRSPTRPAQASVRHDDAAVSVIRHHLDGYRPAP